MGSQLDARLERIERENRQLRWVAGLAILGIVAAFVATGRIGRPSELRGSRFVVTDEKGAERAVLGMTRDGATELRMLDNSGSDLLVLRSTTDGSTQLAFHDRNRERIALTCGSNGSAVLNFLDRRHGTASGMYLLPDGTLGLEMRGGPRALRMSLDAKGESHVAVLDESGRKLGGFQVDAAGTPRLVFTDETGRSIGRRLSRLAEADHVVGGSSPARRAGAP